jgi:hypothetical protein
VAYGLSSGSESGSVQFRRSLYFVRDLEPGDTIDATAVRAVRLFAAACCIGQVVFAFVAPAESRAAFALSAAAAGLLVWVCRFVHADFQAAWKRRYPQRIAG